MLTTTKCNDNEALVEELIFEVILQSPLMWYQNCPTAQVTLYKKNTLQVYDPFKMSTSFVLFLVLFYKITKPCLNSPEILT